MPDYRTGQGIIKEESGFHWILTTIACMLSGTTFLIGVFPLHLSRSFSLIISVFIFTLVAFHKTQIALNKTEITFISKPALFPFYLSRKSFLLSDIQSYNIFDMDRDSRLKNQHFKLRITTIDEKSFIVGLYINAEQQAEYIATFDTILPGKRQETDLDLEIIRKRQFHVKFRDVCMLILVVLGLLGALGIFSYICSL